jgi:hypothetical protein
MNTNPYLRLLLTVQAVCLLGFTAMLKRQGYGGRKTDPAII